MKFSITRMFDLTRVLSTASGQELSDFIETLSQLLDQVLRLSQNKITLDDNLNMRRVSLTVKQGQEQYVLQGLPSGAPALVVLNTSTAPVDTYFMFNWRYDGRHSQIQVGIKPSTPLLIPTTVEVLVFFR